jgi:hypothetical protein
LVLQLKTKKAPEAAVPKKPVAYRKKNGVYRRQFYALPNSHREDSSEMKSCEGDFVIRILIFKFRKTNANLQALLKFLSLLPTAVFTGFASTGTN